MNLYSFFCTSLRQDVYEVAILVVYGMRSDSEAKKSRVETHANEYILSAAAFSKHLHVVVVLAQEPFVFI